MASSKQDASPKLQARNDDYILILIPNQGNSIYAVMKLVVPDNMADAAILSKIRALPGVQPTSSFDLVHSILRHFAMHKFVFGKVQVLELQLLEAQTVPAPHLYKKKKDDTMTQLLLNASARQPSGGSIRAHLINHLANAMYKGEGTHGRHVQVWAFYTELDGFTASMWLLLAIAIAFISGLGIGVGVGDGKLGKSVGTSVLAGLTTMHGVVMLCGA